MLCMETTVAGKSRGRSFERDTCSWFAGATMESDCKWREVCVGIQLGSDGLLGVFSWVNPCRFFSQGSRLWIAKCSDRPVCLRPVVGIPFPVLRGERSSLAASNLLCSAWHATQAVQLAWPTGTTLVWQAYSILKHGYIWNPMERHCFQTASPCTCLRSNSAVGLLPVLAGTRAIVLFRPTGTHLRLRLGSLLEQGQDNPGLRLCTQDCGEKKTVGLLPVAFCGHGFGMQMDKLA